MRIKLIEELPMATSAELYQLSWVIEQLLADPRRIVQVRAQLHTGQQVQYLHWADGKLRSARVVGMHGDHVAIQGAGYSKAFKVHYADYYLRNATYAGGRQANRPNYRHHSGHKPPISFTLLNLSGLSFLIPLNETVTYLDSKEKAKVFNERLSAQQSSLAKDFTACVIAELRGSGFQVEVLDQVVRPAEKPDKVDIDIVTTTSDAVSHVRFTEVGLFSPRSSTDYLPRVNAQATLFVKGLEDDLYNEDLVYGVDARSGKAWAIAGDPEFAYAGFDKVLANIDNVRLALAPPWRMPRQPPQVTRRLLHRTARLRCPSPWVAPSP